MARRQTSFLAKGADRAPCAAKLLLSVAVCLLLVQGGRAQIALRIRPNNDDVGKFVGQDFRRTCVLTVDDLTGVQIEWLRDGTTFFTEIGSSLSLNIPSVQFSDARNYSCKATLSNGTVLGPINAGRLIVYDTSPIMVPRNQYIIYGTDTTLNCSYDDPSVMIYPTVRKDDVPLVDDNRIISANLEDEGEYVCDIFVPGVPQASIDRSFNVHVIVPLELVSHPPAFERIEGNPQKSLSVIFRGREEQNIQITWYKDGHPLRADQVTTTYDSSNLSASTSLNFPAIQRKDSGVYRVVLQSMVGIEFLPRDLLYKEISFQVDVEDPPPTTKHPPTSGTPSILMTVHTSGSNQAVSSAAAIKDTFKSQSTFWLIFIIISLL